jgi:hypothetical protein
MTMRTVFGLILLLGIIVSPDTARTDEKSGRSHIVTAHMFLMAWGHQQWDQMHEVGADQIPVNVGDTRFMVEPGAKKSEVAMVFPFRGLSSVRVNGIVKSVSVDELGLRAGMGETRGPATIALEEHANGFRVVAVSVRPK